MRFPVWLVWVALVPFVSAQGNSSCPRQIAFEKSPQTLGNTRTMNIAAGDVDLDGDIDLLICDYIGPSVLWLNDGHGGFTQSAQSFAESMVHGAGIARLDADAFPDIMLVSQADPSRVYFNNGDGTFSAGAQAIGHGSDEPLQVQLGDVDGDGDVDAFIYHYINPARLWLNDGSGIFAQSSADFGVAQVGDAELVDVNGDGAPDLFMTLINHVDEVWLNDGAGNFTKSGEAIGGTSGWENAAVGDVDGDGDMDLATFNSVVGVQMWINQNGAGSFVQAGSSFEAGSHKGELLDADLDGDLDLVSIHLANGPKLWINDGSSVFTLSGVPLNATRALAVNGSNIDGDDDVDIVFGLEENHGGNPIYINRSLDTCQAHPFSIPITPANAHEVRLLATLSDHLDRVWTVSFSPDGRLLASCGQDGRVLVRNMDSLPASTQMGGFPHWVVGLAFNPDGHYLAYGGATGFTGAVGPIEMWNVDSNHLERALAGHSAGCWSLDFQESSGILASGSFDNTVKLWNPETGLLINTLYGHTAAVLSVDFNPQQNLLASSGIDYSIRLWNSETGSPVRVLTGHTGNVGYVRFSPDGLTVASSADDGTIRLWNVADGSVIWPISAGQGWVNCVNFSPDGDLMVSCGHDGSVVLRDAATGLELKRLTSHTGPVIRGAFDPQGTCVATASWDHTVRLWGIPLDTDADGVPDDSDNCPSESNPLQEDDDGDLHGNACDNCVYVSNPDQATVITMTGDVNDDSARTAADIIAMVNFAFKSGIDPLPCIAAMDVNCDGSPTAADVIYMVNHVFKSGPEPCDVCQIAGLGWTCT